MDTLWFFLIFIPAFEARKSPYYPRIIRFDICKEAPDSPIKWKYVNYGLFNRTRTVISAQCEILQEIHTIKLEADISRCLQIESLDTCQFYQKVNVYKTCEFMAMKGSTWTQILHNFEPKFLCPLKPGNYTLTNGYFQPNAFHLLNMIGWYWRIKLNIFENKRFLFTLCVEFTIVLIK